MIVDTASRDGGLTMLREVFAYRTAAPGAGSSASTVSICASVTRYADRNVRIGCVVCQSDRCRTACAKTTERYDLSSFG